MEKFIVYIKSGLSEETECLKNILRRLGTSLRISESDPLCSADIANTLSLLKINLCFITNSNCTNSTNLWKSFEYLDEFNDYLDAHSQDFSHEAMISQVQSDLCKFANNLHVLADKLPLPGTYLLDILWDWSTEDNWQIEDHLEFFVALKRCVAWHNARVLLIGEELQDRADDWLYILNACVIKLDDDPCNTPLDCLWFGDLDVTEHEEMPGCQGRLPGFCLTYDKDDSLNTTAKANSKEGMPEFEKVSLSSRMEFVCYCQLDSVPSYVIRSGKFGLKTISEIGPMQPSKEWLTSVIQNNKVGVVLRLRFISDDWIAHFYSDFSSSADSWKKALVDEDFDDMLPLLPPDSSQYLFLLVGDSSKSYLEASLHPLKDPATLNGIAAHHTSLQSSLDATAVNDMGYQLIRSILESLPFITKDDFVNAHKTIQALQKEIFQAWITEDNAEDGSVSSPEAIHTLMTLVKDEAMKQLKIPFSFISFTSAADNFLRDNEASQAEHLVDPNDWPERKSLLRREIATEKRKRLKSCEALAPIFASSPDSTVHLSCADFLKCFSNAATDKPKSTPPLEARTNISKDDMLHSFRHSYYSGKDLKEYPWPNVKELQFPDMYYNTDEGAELLESTNCQVKDKCVLRETVSTFVCSAVSELKLRHSSEIKNNSLNIKPTFNEKDSCIKKSETFSPRKHMQSKGHGQGNRHPSHLLLKRSGRHTPKKVPSKSGLHKSCVQPHRPIVKHTPKKISSNFQVSTVGLENDKILSPRRSPRVKEVINSTEKDKDLRQVHSMAITPQRPLPNTKSNQETILFPKRTPKRTKSPLKQVTAVTPRRSPRQHKSVSSCGGNSATKPSAMAKGDILSNLDNCKSPRMAGNQRRSAPVQRRRHGSGSSTSSYSELSQKHVGKLRCAVADALAAQGIDSRHELYNVCGKKLIRICKAFAMDVIGRGRTSVLMREIADAHVKQVINFEKQLGPRR